MCQNMGAAYLSEREARKVLQQQMIPKLAYKMQLSCFSQKQYRKINAQIKRNILPKLRLNRNMPNAVIYGPIEYGGMEMLESYALQYQLQVVNFALGRLLVFHLSSFKNETSISNPFEPHARRFPLNFYFTSQLIS